MNNLMCIDCLPSLPCIQVYVMCGFFLFVCFVVFIFLSMFRHLHCLNKSNEINIFYNHHCKSKQAIFLIYFQSFRMLNFFLILTFISAEIALGMLVEIFQMFVDIIYIFAYINIRKYYLFVELGVIMQAAKLFFRINTFEFSRY